MTDLLHDLERSFLSGDYGLSERLLHELQTLRFSPAELSASRQAWKRVKSVAAKCRNRDQALRSLYFGRSGWDG